MRRSLTMIYILQKLQGGILGTSSTSKFESSFVPKGKPRVSQSWSSANGRSSQNWPRWDSRCWAFVALDAPCITQNQVTAQWLQNWSNKKMGATMGWHTIAWGSLWRNPLGGCASLPPPPRQHTGV